MTPENMSDGGASAYLRISRHDDANGTLNHGETHFFGGNMQYLSFLLGIFGGNGSPWSSSN